MTKHLAHYWRNVLIILPIISTALATVIFTFRLYARYLVVHGLRVEDYLMGMGLLCKTYGFSTCVPGNLLPNTGSRIWDLSPEQRLKISLVQWISQKFWPPAQVFVKVSIVLFLHRLLGCVSRFRQVARAVITFVIAWGVTAIVGNTFQCWPVRYFWIKHIEGHCMRGQNTFYIIIGSASVAEDVFILCLPLPIVRKLQTPLQEKIEITLLFSIGCLYVALRITFRGHNANITPSSRVCIFSILRLVELKNYQTDNLTYSSSLTQIWTVVELNMTIICGSLLLMKPLFQSCMRFLRKGIVRFNSKLHSLDTTGVPMTGSSLPESRVDQAESQ
ncbi:hypothetical protein N7481_007311 [Penicillium waksmanii]|uniref:uncharacterized protein n=1 Tax=Penicillium waksmanii TaxID=69791 RepID=UPI002547E2BF|nr:uncharacterized protein N7481_007311 [Penicillium waksmanii]KAJ5980013.1 hypothetical protein N7481_007311 [Penicillium waksmanii]